jgi:hypothetical protein
MASAPHKSPTEPVTPIPNVDPAHSPEQADNDETKDDGIVRDVFGDPYDIWKQYISYQETVATTVPVRNPDTGKTDMVPSSTIKTHLCPLDRWAAYERAHFGVK